MANPFVTNDPAVKNVKLVIKGVGIVAFHNGICDPADYGMHASRVRKALRERTSWPIYGVHFHLKQGEDDVSEEPPVGIHQGPISTQQLKGMSR